MRLKAEWAIDSEPIQAQEIIVNKFNLWGASHICAAYYYTFFSNMALKKQHKARWNKLQHGKIPTRQRNMAYSLKWEMTVCEIQTRDIHIPPPPHTCSILWQTYTWLFLISHCIFCSLLLYFCTEFSWQYNAMHKFVRALNTPPPIQEQTSQVSRFWGVMCTVLLPKSVT